MWASAALRLPGEPLTVSTQRALRMRWASHAIVAALG